MSLSTIERVLGISIPAETVLDVLSRLSFEPKVDDGSTLTVRVPTWRSDVSIAEDIVEEVARIVGYDQLPTTLPTGKTPPIERNPPYQFERRIREALVGAGCVEGRSYVTASREDLVRLGGPDCVGFVHRVHPDSLITLRNPVHSEENVLRPTIIPQLVAATAANLKHERTVRLFEIAPVYLSVERAALPDEPSTLGIVLAGDRVPLSPFSLQHPGEQLDFFDLKGIVQAVLDRAGAGRTCWEATDHPALHSGRAARVTLGDQTVGIVGELLPSVATACGIEHLRVGVAEIDLAGLLAVVERAEPPTVTVPRFLPVQQDFAVVVARETPAADVERALRSGAGPLATDVTLFDLYAGEPLGPGEKSLAYRVTFTAPDRALTDAELGRVRERIQRHLADQVDGALRT